MDNKNITAEQKCPINYFPNEKGDYTITRYDEPCAIAKNERDAYYLVNTYKSLTMRISVLLRTVDRDREKFDELVNENKIAQDTIRRKG
jgi:hypothetical protein